VGEIDFGGGIREECDPATGVFVAFFEGLELCRGRAPETKRLGHFRPVELKCCAALGRS